MTEKKKVGRPLKLVKEVKYHEHVVLPPEVENILIEYANKWHKTKSDIISDLISASLSRHPKEIELEKLEEEKAYHDKKSAELAARIITIKNQIKQDEEFRKSLMKTNEYLIQAFSMVYELEKRNGKITMLMDAMERVYGITFNVQKCNENFSAIPEMSNDEIIKTFELKKLPIHAKKEEDVLRKIGI